MRFVSAKQLIFPFGIERLPPAPGLADARIARTVEELPEQPQLVGLFRPAPLLQQIGNEAGQALVLLGCLDSRPAGEIVLKRDGDVLHETDFVFPCFRVKSDSELRPEGRISLVAVSLARALDLAKTLRHHGEMDFVLETCV